MTIDWIDILVTVLTAGVFSLIGFVWKFSHKVTKMEQTLSDNKRRIKNMEEDHDKAIEYENFRNHDKGMIHKIWKTNNIEI